MSQPPSFDWSGLVVLLVPPMKVMIIETLIMVGEPISATDLRKVFGGEFSSATLSRHLAALAKAGVVEVVNKGRVRGATEKFYFLSEALMAGPKAGSPAPVTPEGNVTAGIVEGIRGQVLGLA